MVLNFSGEIVYWRGPAPFFFLTIPEDPSSEIKALSPQLTYGWGVIPVRAKIGSSQFNTALFPKKDLYLLPVKASIRTSEKIELGDIVDVLLELG